MFAGEFGELEVGSGWKWKPWHKIGAGVFGSCGHRLAFQRVGIRREYLRGLPTGGVVLMEDGRVLRKAVGRVRRVSRCCTVCI